MRKDKPNFILPLLLLAAGFASVLLFGGAESSLILSFGIRAASFIMKAVPTVLLGAGIVTGGISTYKAVKLNQSRLLERKKEAERIGSHNVVEEEYARDASSPEATRAKLMQIREESPGLSELIERCLLQMDRMDDLQRRQKELIGINSAAYLNDTVATLDEVERALCLNYRSIVNQCIIAGSDASESKLDMERVEKVMDANAKLLSQAKELLKVSAEWIDKYNGQEVPDRSLLDNWIRVIRDTIGKEE